LNDFKEIGSTPNLLVKRKYVTKKPVRLDNDTDTAANVLSSMNADGTPMNKKKSRQDDEDDDADIYDTTTRSNNVSMMNKTKFCFTDADDKKIIEAHTNYTTSDTEQMHTETGILKKWQYVADFLNNGATAHQVGRRWREKLDPNLSALKSGTFSNEEDERLLHLIEEHASDGRGGGRNWTSIAAKMNRRSKECEHRGATLLAKHQKQGNYYKTDIYLHILYILIDLQ
jgi:hypothetical protein